jgi:pyridoxal phosphate enzyme (YggS family)
MAIGTDDRATRPVGDALRQRYDAVRQRLADAAERSGRRPEEIILVAVTRDASIDQIRRLVAWGHMDLGEDRVQAMAQHAAQLEEFLERHREFPSASHGAVPARIRWHMIGHLQRNRARKIVERVRLVHTLDSLRLAEELQAVAASRLDTPLEVLVQVNVADGRHKSGIAPAAVPHLIDQLDTMFNLRARGLMCLAPPADDPETSRPVFTRCQELFDDIRRTGVAGDRFDILSMGTSLDFDVAVECGANIVRVGRAIFGEE